MPAVERGSPDPALIDPRDFGSLVHHVLERIDFADSVLRGSPDPALAADGDRVRDWCEQLAPDHVLLNAAAAAREAEQMIARFVASPRGRQLAAASVVHREVEFLLAWPPEDNVDLPPSDSQRYLQGYIDCLYQDAAGDWRLMDYKTNDVPAAAVPHVAKQYEMQLYVYALVIERALGTPPRELVLHFLRPGVEHIVPWNAAARRRAMEMVNEAIAMSLTASDAALPVNAGLVTSVTSG
jgi:ATP-dependent exoDNAse (exonuclease V) beta subunit